MSWHSALILLHHGVQRFRHNPSGYGPRGGDCHGAIQEWTRRFRLTDESLSPASSAFNEVWVVLKKLGAVIRGAQTDRV